MWVCSGISGTIWCGLGNLLRVRTRITLAFLVGADLCLGPFPRSTPRFGADTRVCPYHRVGSPLQGSFRHGPSALPFMNNPLSAKPLHRGTMEEGMTQLITLRNNNSMLKLHFFLDT